MSRAFAAVGVAYATAVAVAVAAAVGAAVGLGWEHPIALAAAADVAATAVIFAFSRFHDNSSFYDAYWSVAPIVIALYWVLTPEAAGADVGRQVLVTTLIALWGVRLTYNWARGWTGLGHEDWRYVNLRDTTGRAYWAVSFLGLHMMPTVMVFAGCLAAYPALVTGGAPAGVLDAAALAVTAGAIWIEAAADQQLRRFVTSGPEPGAILDRGLWKLSRHPNYFGEMSFWWGLYLFGLAADPSWWWTFVGPLAITLMFRFISLPMIEKRMVERRPGFADHAERTSLVIPWFAG
jgi:steroid 5-alpha reductase family enzyme